jgi:glycosyltransferase involved in cell wall biosynthesis
MAPKIHRSALDFTTKPLKVLQLIPALKTGGVEQSAVEMAQWLQSQGHHAFVAGKATPQSPPKARQLAQAGVVWLPLNLASKNPFLQVWNVLRLCLYVKQHGIQLLHVRSRLPGWVAYCVSRLCKLPMITTFHGTYGLNGGSLKRFYNSVMTRSPIVIANSHFIAQHIRQEYQVPPAQIVVAPRGITPAEWNPDAFSVSQQADLHKSLKIPPGHLVLICAGRLTSWKGQWQLLQALAQLVHLPWHLLLVGGAEKNGHYAAELERFIAQNHLATRVSLLGNRTDLPQLYALSQLAAVPSIRPEAFGRSVIEAMAMRVPVVAAGHGGPLEIITPGATGWLYPPAPAAQAPHALAQTLRQALANPAQLTTVGHAARAHVLQHYTVAQCCETEFAAYLTVLKQAQEQKPRKN